jgi:hypothetical protein
MALNELTHPWISDVEERESFDSSLARLTGWPPEMQYRASPQRRMNANLYRLAVDSATRRYLAFGLAFIDSSSSAEAELQLAFYALDFRGPTPTISRAYRLGTGNEAAVLLAGVRDWDGDGLADAVYCRWADTANYEYGPRPTGGRPIVIGYRGDAWYVVPVTLELDCDALYPK